MTADQPKPTSRLTTTSDTPGKTGNGPGPSNVINLSLFDDLQVTLDVHLGNATMSLSEIRSLKPKSVVPLDIKLDQAATIRFRGAVIARGEIVAVDDSFGIRITEIGPVEA